MTRLIEWQFGGWLGGIPPAMAWSILSILAVAAVLLVVGLYRRTLQRLSPTVRNLLTVLRVSLVLLLLLCLANPTRIEKSAPAGKKPLAVLVDRSASMGLPDHRRITRLADAVRVWKQHESEAAASFSDIAYHRFAVNLTRAPSLEEAVAAAEPGPETHLYAALKKALDTGCGAIVCLTDGLDTTASTGTTREELIGEAMRRNVPLYFVAGVNRLLPSRSGELMRVNIHELKAPALALRQTQFSVSAVIEAVSPHDAQVPVELWSGGTNLASATLPIRAGNNILPWSVPVTAAMDGNMSLEVRVGKAPQESASCMVEVVDHKTIDVLYYQGALQWGYRYLRLALASEPAFRMTSILNPALHVQLTVDDSNQPTLPDLPETADQLKPFQIVILAHVFANRLSARQQAALVEYVQGGGTVLFIAPDSQVTTKFAGTALEQMLPVFFAPLSASEAEEMRSDDLRRNMNNVRAPVGWESESYGGGRQTLAGLKPFALPTGAPRSAISALFEKNDQSLPYYFQNARVQGVKPGAEVLAVSQSTGAKQQVLLARQQFGNGFAVAMMTDLLWRWKMSLPSNSHALEKFWQQLLSALTSTSTEKGLRLAKLSVSPYINQTVMLQITGDTAEIPPKVEAISPLQQHRALTLQPATEGEGAWTASFTPATTGNWTVVATAPIEKSARLSFPVLEKSRSATAEMMNLPSDVIGMRRLAEVTGGALIEDAPVFQTHAESAGASTRQQAQPLWNSAWLLATLLGLYAIELIVRRRFRLV